MPKKKVTKSSVKGSGCAHCDTSVHPLHRVTPLSKTIAMILFITLPLLAFALGASYQKTIDINACPVLGAYYVE